MTASASPPRPAASAQDGQRARPRDRAATEERLLNAVGEVLAREGFQAIGVGSVAREAGVDKVLIYRYFGGLPGLLQAWGASGRFWPRVADLLALEGEGFMQRPPAERWVRFFEHFIDELRRRPLTLAVLAVEVQERNELTAILETEREEWGAEAARVLGGPEFDAAPHVRTLTLLLVAGVQYLAVRARRIRWFGGVDIQSDVGWTELKGCLRVLADRLLPAAGRADSHADRDGDPPAARRRAASAHRTANRSSARQGGSR